MRTQCHSKRKTILRSSFVIILTFSILISSISVSFASYDTPSGLTEVTDLVYLEGALDWIENWFEQDPNGYLWIYSCSYEGVGTRMFCCFCSADTSIYFNDSSGQVFLNSTSGYDLIVINYNQGVQYNFGNTSANQGPTSTGKVDIDNISYYPFRLPLNNAWQCDFYCSVDFIDNGGDVYKNLDVSSYLPPPYYLAAFLSDDHEFIIVDVNFNVDVFPSMVSLWGYNEFGATPYNYVRDEYKNVQFDMGTDGIHSIFKVPLAPFRAHYLGNDFTIASISVIGWDEVGHEEWESLNWNLSELTPGENNPPTTNYYNSYVYDSNYYTNLDRSVVSFGNVKIRLHTSTTLGNVWWDQQQTTVTPFNYSYIFIPQLDWAAGYDSLLKQLCLEFDLVFINCPQDLVDYIYGSGTTQDIITIANQNSLVLEYIYSLNPIYERLPYDVVLASTYLEWTCGCLYTDSFYLKNLAYFFGDNNDLLLELETRLFKEDGSFDLLFKNMGKMYENDFSYYSDMITYMDKLNYLVYVITNIDYFNTVLSYLKTISEKDFTIDLPEFDFTTVLGKYPDSNLSNLTDFISHSVSDLPTWDFSSLSTFTGAIGDLFTSVAPDGEFIENISNPYSFGDSVEDDLFPDNE